MADHPYQKLADRAFWKTGVVDQHALNPSDIYTKKFEIAADDKVATAGSCFAQHISRHLRGSGYTVLDVEPAPQIVPAEIARKYGYHLYSARYGNIYTTRQLLQLTKESLGQFSPHDIVWEKDGRFFDALRPSVEPNGLSSADEVKRHRQQHLNRVAKLLKETDIFVFTLGLTETWEHKDSGTVYPTAPGVIAGSFNGDKVRFKNLTFHETLADFEEFRAIMHTLNPKMRFLVTVSPVPLTATASGDHILPATIYSKSVLRAVAGQLASSYQDVDYFPSYEIIAGHPARGMFFKNNLREVDERGVDVVMKVFSSQHPAKVAKAAGSSARSAARDAAELVCEEALLEAFK